MCSPRRHLKPHNAAVSGWTSFALGARAASIDACLTAVFRTVILIAAGLELGAALLLVVVFVFTVQFTGAFVETAYFKSTWPIFRCAQLLGLVPCPLLTDCDAAEVLRC